MSDRRERGRDRERDRAIREEEDERRAETERRGEQLREAWRQRHPESEDDKGDVGRADRGNRAEQVNE